MAAQCQFISSSTVVPRGLVLGKLNKDTHATEACMKIFKKFKFTSSGAPEGEGEPRPGQVQNEVFEVTAKTPTVSSSSVCCDEAVADQYSGSSNRKNIVASESPGPLHSCLPSRYTGSVATKALHSVHWCT